MTEIDLASIGQGKRVGILTSGGDAQGMNAAVRAVVRTAISAGAEVFAIYEGFQGMVDGGDGIRQFGWEDVSSVLNLGGTLIGTFRSQDFREYSGRVKAAQNLLKKGIDRVVVIGGDGSLSGLNEFAQEWPQILAELAKAGKITQKTAKAHPQLYFAGLVGSIDNDLVGTDMTIGADSALHRIVHAIDALASTAASHQRAFVIEVMGRHCGYLGLMSAIAGGCDYVLIPEEPPEPGWEDRMCDALRKGREGGRRDSMVVVAEGAIDREGNPITSDYVRRAIEERTKEDARVTILGHVQRGGTPSAYDRWASTWLGYEAAIDVLRAEPGAEGMVLGFRGNRITRVPLVQAVEDTRSVPKLIAAGDYGEALRLRGGSFAEMVDILAELVDPSEPPTGPQAKRVAVMHAGALAPGMNVAARAAVRLGVARGFNMLGIHGGFPGLAEGRISELRWADVEGWIAAGAELGLRRAVPGVEELYAVSRALEESKVDALLIIGGWDAYQAAYLMSSEASRYPAFQIPIVCVPASIDNNLPGSELAIGADTALNVIAEAIDRIKMSGHAATRAFVVETMGRYCGYLAAMGGLSGGAERIYLHEDGLTLAKLEADVRWLNESFRNGRKLFLAIRNECANQLYTTDFIARLLEEEGGDLYDVRTAILGHVQQGGDPTPFDRLLATRLASRALTEIQGQFDAGEAECSYLGMSQTGISRTPMSRLPEEFDLKWQRPKKQWWMQLKPVIEAVSDH
ncbi:MAG: 6-phosphofructokinase [Propionibacteriaceae bacterium]|nr:6-phosphofructokinase [Propionibacteriaceae bacterium]